MTRHAYQRVALLMLLLVVLMGTLPHRSSARPSTTDRATTPTVAADVQQQPENNAFDATTTLLDPSTFPVNYTFTQARQSLPTSGYPTNYNFASGSLSGWTASDPNAVRVVNDANSIDGAYLHLNGARQWALSDAFVIPTDAQSLRFDYMAWTPRDPNEGSRLYVEVLSGRDFGVRTRLGELVGTRTQGWQRGMVDLQTFQGRTVKLHVRADDDNWYKDGQVRLDNLTLHTEIPSWTSSDARQVQIVTDASSIDGAYLHLNGARQWALSTAFRVPPTAQSLRFDYWAWTPRNVDEGSRLYVEVLSGTGFGVRTRLGELVGTRT